MRSRSRAPAFLQLHADSEFAVKFVRFEAAASMLAVLLLHRDPETGCSALLPAYLVLDRCVTLDEALAACTSQRDRLQELFTIAQCASSSACRTRPANRPLPGKRLQFRLKSCGVEHALTIAATCASISATCAPFAS